jgi:hypothetical protein
MDDTPNLNTGTPWREWDDRDIRWGLDPIDAETVASSASRATRMIALPRKLLCQSTNKPRRRGSRIMLFAYSSTGANRSCARQQAKAGWAAASAISGKVISLYPWRSTPIVSAIVFTQAARCIVAPRARARAPAMMLRNSSTVAPV